MKRWLADQLNKHPLGLLSLRTLHLRHFLRESGWFRSAMSGVPVDSSGKPLPWIPYSALRFLEDRIGSDFRVFEYGSGNSSLWWHSHVEDVVSVEHDEAWYRQLLDKVTGDRECVLVANHDAYPKAIHEFGRKFDIVFIDGIKRNECAVESVTALTARGVIVWDNSNRSEYDVGMRHLENAGFSRIDFWGLGPISWREGCASIFYRPDNCLKI